MTNKKDPKFRFLYITGIFMIFIGGDIESDFAGFVGFFTILFTGLAHLIVKIVSTQEGFRADMTQGYGRGTPTYPQANRSYFNSGSQGNYQYDRLIQKMQLTDLSGMSVDQATSKYASFFKYPVVSAKPFFSNPYVQEVLNIGTQVTPQSIAGTYSTTPATTPSSSGAFWSSMPSSSTEAIDVCANPTCSTPVTVFDFRCFKCRNRFCAACKGDKITCPSCS